MANTSLEHDVTAIFLGIGIVLYGQITILCIQKAYKRRHHTDYIQAIASLLRFFTSIFFIIFFTTPASSILDGQCRLATDLTEPCFFIFQILSTGLLIMRGSALLEGWKKVAYRVVLGVLLALAIGLIASATVLKKADIIEDRCVALYDRPLNTSGKAILALVYCIIFATFVVLLMSHIRQLRQMELKNSIVFSVMANVSFRISLAVMAYLISVSLSFSKVWGSLFYIQFTVEDYAVLLASMAASHQKKSDDKKFPNDSARALFRQSSVLEP